MTPVTPSPSGNRLLDAMPRKDRQRFLTGCQPVTLSFAEVLATPGEPIRQVFFPTDSFISLISPNQSCPPLEVGLVGNEGMLGTALVLGVGTSPLHALVQGAGPALRMRAAPFRRELARSPALLRLLQRYLHVVMRQLAQTAACTRFHLLDARLARWLLMTQDRAHSREFHVTHEFLAFMLGVRRVGITKAATALQNHGLIRYARGNIMVLDRAGLESASCGCYQADQNSYSQFLD